MRKGLFSSGPMAYKFTWNSNASNNVHPQGRSYFYQTRERFGNQEEYSARNTSGCLRSLYRLKVESISKEFINRFKLCQNISTGTAMWEIQEIVGSTMHCLWP